MLSGWILECGNGESNKQKTSGYLQGGARMVINVS
jgi:hypothetical protein